MCVWSVEEPVRAQITLIRFIAASLVPYTTGNLTYGPALRQQLSLGEFSVCFLKLPVLIYA